MIPTSVSEAEVKTISHHDIAEVRQDTLSGHKGLFSLKPCKKGDSICAFGAALELTYPTYLTVQISEEKHITLQPDFLQYINHSCQPNAFFNTTNLMLECIKDIAPGDEITFFYPSTEWRMVQPFECRCNKPNCLHIINGAADMSLTALHKYKLTDFIQKQLAKQI